MDSIFPLRSEIRDVQHQLKTAIQRHQSITAKLKDRPKDVELKVRLLSVQRSIMKLGENQKNLLRQLRKELDANSTNGSLENPFLERVNEKSKDLRTEPVATCELSAKNSLSSLSLSQDLDTKPVLKKEEEKDHSESESVPKNGEKDCLATSASIKKDELSEPSKQCVAQEKIVNNPSRNDLKTTESDVEIDVPAVSQVENPSKCTRQSDPIRAIKRYQAPKKGLFSPSTPPLPKNSRKRVPPSESCQSSSGSDDSQDCLASDPSVSGKLQFMTAIGLIKPQIVSELQTRRTERKRRSTANPQFVYGSLMDNAVKRKKNCSSVGTSGGSSDTSHSDSVDEEGLQVPPKSKCFICSSAKDYPNLRICEACRRPFHWKCAFSDSSPSSPAKCHICSNSSSEETGTGCK